jgi:guanylate kinase
MSLLCHIAGPSGSGKTTVLQKIYKLFPNIITKDLDEFDDEASAILGLDSTQKKYWQDRDLLNLAELRQKLMNEFLAQHSNNSVVLAGFHTEGPHTLKIPTSNKFLLDISAEESAHRAYKRSQNEEIKFKRTLEDLPYDIAEAQKDINFLVAHNYQKMSEEDIVDFIRNLHVE